MKITVQKTMNVLDPARAHDTDAGLDLYVPEGQGVLVRRGAVYTIDLGVRVAIPDGYYGQLTLRSSAGAKGLTIPNGTGVIDSGYRGNLKVLVAALADPVLVAARDRICQLIVLPLPSVEYEPGIVDDNTDRSTGGFGSTGTGAAGCDCATDNAGGTPHGGDLMSDKKEKTDNRNYLTVDGLMRELQEIASRHGNIPVVVHSSADADYEQATAPIVTHGRREVVPGDWDLFHVEPDGEPVVVIS